MNYALVKNGICENVIEADQNFIENILSKWDEIIPAEGTLAERGAIWDGTIFTRKEPPIPLPTVDPFTAINAKLDKVIADIDIIKLQTKPKV